MAKAADLRVQSTEELEALLRENKAKMFTMRSAIASNDKEMKPSMLRVLRKDNARVLTILTERRGA
jgi:ribosomal protein L29